MNVWLYKFVEGKEGGMFLGNLVSFIYNRRAIQFFVFALLQAAAIIVFMVRNDAFSDTWYDEGETTKNFNTNAVHQVQVSTQQPQPILMFIAIMSAPRRVHRRNAIRRSWMQQCHNHNTTCYIFTDAQDVHGEKLPEHVYVPLKQEQSLHKDLIFTESPGGINFARRYLWIINWASKKYTFEFLLRVDDDYFICMDRLFLELPCRRTVKKIYWGFIYCKPGAIRVDEGFVIVSNDLIREFIKKENTSLMCHPFGDQAMAMWINGIENVTYFGDARVRHHIPKNNDVAMKQNDSNLCKDFLAIHGSYPVQIERYWQRMILAPFTGYHIPPITYSCGKKNKTYNKYSFDGKFRTNPIPCRDSPVWNISSFWPGRSKRRA